MNCKLKVQGSRATVQGLEKKIFTSGFSVDLVEELIDDPYRYGVLYSAPGYTDPQIGLHSYNGIVEIYLYTQISTLLYSMCVNGK